MYIICLLLINEAENELFLLNKYKAEILKKITIFYELLFILEGKTNEGTVSVIRKSSNQ